jgi:hypothetical protein
MKDIALVPTGFRMAETTGEEGGGVRREFALGISLPDFKAAVDATKEMVSDGIAQLFLSRPYRLRLVGDSNAWRAALARRVGENRVAGVLYDAQTEMLKCLEYCLMRGDLSDDIGILERHYIFGRHLAGMSEQEKELGREVIRQKLRYTRELLLSPSLRTRVVRLASATGPCLEDLDIEIIGERWDLLDRSVTGQPFVRLQLRYSQAQGPDACSLKAWGTAAWGVDIPPLWTFGLELDETDIDLMIDRLRMAKHLLSEALKKASHPSNEASK